MDALRSPICKLDFVTDGSFSSSLARIHRRVFPALIADLIEPARRQEVTKAFSARVKESGVQATQQELLNGALTELGKKAAGEAGAVFCRQAAEGLCNLIKRGSTLVLEFLINTLEKFCFLTPHIKYK